ncbi:MAG: ATP-binding protein [Pseudonocardiaceae bacterium]
MPWADASIELEPNADMVAEARRFLRDALAVACGAVEAAEVLVLGANELVTNAVIHARTEFRVTVRRDRDRVRVEVIDGNSRMPQPCLAPWDATSGRGLAIIDGLGLNWGAERHRLGKIVWVEAVLA